MDFKHCVVSITTMLDQAYFILVQPPSSITSFSMKTKRRIALYTISETPVMLQKHAGMRNGSCAGLSVRLIGLEGLSCACIGDKWDVVASTDVYMLNVLLEFGWGRCPHTGHSWASLKGSLTSKAPYFVPLGHIPNITTGQAILLSSSLSAKQAIRIPTDNYFSLKELDNIPSLLCGHGDPLLHGNVNFLLRICVCFVIQIANC